MAQPKLRSLCLVPVYNEATRLPSLLAKCRAGFAADDIVFVDDGSDDGSTDLIEASGFHWIRTKKRCGIGHALITGTKYAIDNGYDIIVHMAGNGKMLPSEMERVVRPVASGEVDYAWGSRFLSGGEFTNAPLFRRIAIPLLRMVPLLFTGRWLSDVTCGFRAYRMSILKVTAVDWSQPWLYGYEFEYYVLIKMLRGGYRYREVPISMVYPPEGKNYSKITPVISWWAMLKPWLIVRLGLESRLRTSPLPTYESPKKTA